MVVGSCYRQDDRRSRFARRSLFGKRRDRRMSAKREFSDSRDVPNWATGLCLVPIHGDKIGTPLSTSVSASAGSRSASGKEWRSCRLGVEKS